MNDFDANKNGIKDFCNECISDDQREDHDFECTCYCHNLAIIIHLQQKNSDLRAKVDELERNRVNEFARASRIIEWLNSAPRKSASTAFTEGPERQVAYALEAKVERMEKALEDIRDFDAKNSNTLRLIAKQALAGEG